MPDRLIITHDSQSFQRHVAPADRPFVVLLERQCTDEARDRFLVGEDGDDVGAPLDLAVEALDRVGNRYEIIGACVRLRFILPRRMVRPSGTEAPGA